MKVLFIILSFAITLQAFEYNGFKSKMTIEDVVDTAQEKNIPITCKSYTLKKEFHWSLLEKCQLHDRLRYYAKTFETPSYTSFYFTSISKKLYHIHIYWMINDLIVNHNQKIKNSELRQILFNILSKKYGTAHRGLPKDYLDLTQQLLFGAKTYYWNIDQNNVAILSAQMAQISLDYIDKSLKSGKEQKEQRKKMMTIEINKNINQF